MSSFDEAAKKGQVPFDWRAKSIDGKDDDKLAHFNAFYVVEPVPRICHWVNALCILILIVTGYLIGAPPETLSGEASKHYMFGYIRFAHFTSAYIFIISSLLRVYWAFVGNHYSVEMYQFPFWRMEWWRQIWIEARWYLFLETKPHKYIGHNPLAQASIWVFSVFICPFMIFTGLALYSQGTGYGSWQDVLFGWIIDVVGQGQMVHTLHHFGMYVVLLFFIFHTYVVIREDIMSRQSMISTMISGVRTFKDDDP